MGSFAFDVRDALRRCWRDRTYTATSVLTLALTVGAATAMFSIVNGVLLRPLPYRDSHRLVALRELPAAVADSTGLEVNERHFEYWRAHARSFESMAQFRSLPGNITGGGDPAEIVVARASGSLFDVLQAHAAVGRTLTPDDEPEGRPDVVVVSDGLWRQRFGANPDAVGRTVAIDGTPRTIVGVLPASFRLPERGQLTDGVHAFIPLRVNVGWTGDYNNPAIGRLRDGVDVQQARAELDVLQGQVSVFATEAAHEKVSLTSVVTPLSEAIVGSARRGLLLLFGAIIGVLLIACSNLANLSLARTTGRLRDAAIRSALGAGRARLVLGSMLEQLVLAAVGGALAIAIASAALGVFVRTAPIDLPRAGEVGLDVRVLLFAAAVSIMAAAVVAIVPAWRIAGRDVHTTLRAGGAAVSGERASMRLRGILLAAQVGLAVTLLAVTALLSVSFLRVLGVDRGFSAERVLTVAVAMPGARYATEPVRQATYDRLLTAVRGLPAVRGATTASMVPLTGSGQTNFIVPDGYAGPIFVQPSANFRFVGPEYFKTLEIVIRRGRAFTDAEREPARPAPVVISEPVAATLWPDQDPIGKRFSRGFPGEQGFEVVGVAANARVTSIERTPPLMVYVPYWWRTRAAMSLLVKTAGDPESLLPSIRRVVREIDPEIAIGRVRPLTDVVDAAVAGRRYQARLFVVFGAAALFIATVGVYGVTSYCVLWRRREMNIRTALGARRSEVVGMVIRQTGVPLAIGLAAGLAGAVASSRLIASMLFDVTPNDPIVLAAVPAIVAAVGLLATLGAAERGLQLDPAGALRSE